MEVAPINVPYKDEIGEVARAFDQVHSEAVRLAGEQALLRSTFNAMFVNLSRRSQSLIERLARMIDNLEQNEADPDRLGDLFSMDHLVTRMRRNSENLLLLAGHENPRKRSEPVALADVARAAISEIEQYNRITLNITPGIAVVGVAVSDVAHLLAELIENATIFSSKDTPVQVAMQEVASGGVLIEIRDKGIGVSDARLGGHELAARQPPDHRRVRLAAHGPVRGGAPRRAAPSPGPAAVGRPAGAVRPGLAAGRRRRADQHLRSRRELAEPVRRRDRGAASGGRPAAWRDARGRRRPRAERYRQRERVACRSPAQAKGWFRGRGGASEGSPAAAGVGLAPDWRAARGESFDQTSTGLPVRTPRASQNSDTGTDSQAGLPGWADSGHGGPAANTGLAPDWRAARNGSFDQTSTGLPVRTPRASQNSDTGTDPQAGLPGWAESARGGPTPGSGTRTGSQPLPQRSPDQVRSRLAGFQRGTRRAESEHGQSPRAGEGSER